MRKLYLAIAFSVICGTLWSQAVSTSQVSGTVQDSSGAAVPTANVTFRQIETGQVRSVLTGNDGTYLISNLPIGPYRMEVAREGFATFVQTGIVLNVNTNPTLNATLKVGGVNEQVMVQSEALAVETHSSGVGQVISHQEVAELPLNAREPTQLILLAGNATTQGTVANDLNSNKNFPTITLSVAGGNGNQISFSLDGGTANNPFNGLNQPLPFPDALQEFKVETSSVGAQTGQHASASVTVATRSGTNSLHGNLFEYTRNYLFNGRSATALVRDSLKQNQFGGTIGGAIIKNRLFFFGGEQSTIKKSNPANSQGYSMTPAMLNGDFSVIASTQCQPKQITLAAPFVNNVIPKSLMDPIALNIAKLLPTDQVNQCGLVNYATGGNQQQYQIPIKIDYTINAKHSMFGRYMLSNNDTPLFYDASNPLFTGSTTGQKNKIHSVVLGETWVVSPKVISSAHIAMNRGVNPRFIPAFKTPADFGIPISAFIPAQMNLSVTNGFTLAGGASNPGYFNTLDYSASEDITIIKGKHQTQLGGQYIRAYMHAQNTRGVNGNLNFTGQYSTVGGTASLGYADFVTGQLNAFGQGRPFYDNDKSDYYGLYVQDAWRVSSHLSINLGVRFEPYLPQRNTDGYVEAFSMSNFLAGKTGTPPVSSPVLTPPAGLIFPGDQGYPPNNQYNNRANHWLPRIGVVWDPFGDGKTSIRASYGLLYDTPHLFFYTRVSNNPPWGATLTRSGGPFPLSNPWAGYPGGDPYKQNTGTAKSYGFFPTSGVYAVSDPNLGSPQINTWNLSIQRQVGKWLISGSYLGNHTAHLWSSRELNPQIYIPGNCTAGQYGLTAPGPCSSTSANNTAARRLLTLANPTWGPWYSTIAYLDAGATSSYNGMILSAQHRMSNNFSMLANWTYSHCLADPSTTELTGPSYVDPNNRSADRSNCSSDHRQQVNISGVLTTPTVHNRLLGLLTNGWQAAPIFHWSTGNLTTVTYGTDVALTGAGNQRAQQILPNVYTANRSITNYLNINAFLSPAAAPAGVYASTRPFTVSGPNVMNIDLAFSRNFRIRERHTMQFRAEAFNLPNSVMFGPPTGALNSANFGRLTPQIQSSAPGSTSTARIMQFAIKYAF
uniref:TonB-dependent receptor n=1 Tax=Solibacter usitatus (strain Ellin6076) TaxID=234267 RepID=Q022M5_SOLUE